jgi:3-oxoacyl-[acyl-carrier protein] reductase
MKKKRNQLVHRISDRPVAIVTGAGKRLGRHIAIALGENGYSVVVNYHSSKAGAIQTVNAIKKMGSDAIALRSDVSKRKEVVRLVRQSLSKFGRIDLLVNNAAVFIDSPLNSTTDMIWNDTLDINLKGTFLCCQIVSRQMLKQKSGRIINIASLGGIQAWAEHVPYSISKAGVIMLTKILAKTLAPDICVNAIAPGTILMKREKSTIRHLPQRKIPLKKFGTPLDISSLVIYLATTASYITGQIFSVDGGRSIQ